MKTPTFGFARIVPLLFVLLALAVLARVAHSSARVPEPVPGEPLEILRASGDSSSPGLSADGRWALFASHAANLTAETRNAYVVDLFLRDLLNRTNYLVSASIDRTGGGNGDCEAFRITANGQWAVFQSSPQS